MINANYNEASEGVNYLDIPTHAAALMRDNDEAVIELQRGKKVTYDSATLARNGESATMIPVHYSFETEDNPDAIAEGLEKELQLSEFGVPDTVRLRRENGYVSVQLN